MRYLLEKIIIPLILSYIFLTFISIKFIFSATNLTNEIKAKIDEIFSPPTEEEIQKVWEALPKDIECKEFKTISEHYSDEDITVYKIEYQSEGLKITGLLAKPNKGIKFPAIILNHGGFSGITKYDEKAIFSWARKGYIAVASTYRGEKGIAGESEGELDIFCGNEVVDVITLFNCVKDLSELDDGKIIMLGGSHGGCITMSAAQRVKGLRVAISFSGPADMFNDATKKMAIEFIKNPRKQKMLMEQFVTLETMEKIEDFFLTGIYGKKGITTEKMRLELLKRSPLYFMRHLSSPLIFFYGGLDPIVSPENAESLAKKLREEEKIFEYKLFPQQGHSIVGKDREEANKMVDEFIKKYINGLKQE